ncbi:2,4'-dihydroxyacetophenone dioxygenase family protein [Nocardioides sambongensis]|uniref:2,4'-dihydroxyacetophenone dioxygenase family protein n=1 Tax=Nocardioides sambongensis TaxID=2589074 RepID=UPI00112C60CC|nr:2,4'-dihydroxyacetophenone dioxygenase family protein [Nocardioides sambongensis]
MTTTSRPPTPNGVEPFRGKQPADIVEDLVITGALELDEGDERLWVPQTEGVSFRPLLLSVTQGYFVNLLRVRRAGVLSRHRHAGPVHAFPLRGRWYYLEHDWVATTFGYAFEPPGETHTLVVPDDVDEMITLFHVTGTYVYVDPDGNAVGYEDVFTKLEAARRHYQQVGLGADYVERYVR